MARNSSNMNSNNILMCIICVLLIGIVIVLLLNMNKSKCQCAKNNSNLSKKYANKLSAYLDNSNLTENQIYANRLSKYLENNPNEIAEKFTGTPCMTFDSDLWGRRNTYTDGNHDDKIEDILGDPGQPNTIRRTMNEIPERFGGPIPVPLHASTLKRLLSGQQQEGETDDAFRRRASERRDKKLCIWKNKIEGGSSCSFRSFIGVCPHHL